MKSSQAIENVYKKIFERMTTQNIGIYGMAVKVGYENEKNKILFLKEITQQLDGSRPVMIEVFGEEIINDIDALKLKVPKIKTSNSRTKVKQ